MLDAHCLLAWVAGIPPLKDGCPGLTTNLYALILVDTWGDRAIILPVPAAEHTIQQTLSLVLV